jgi:hypothetical protein
MLSFLMFITLFDGYDPGYSVSYCFYVGGGTFSS